MTTTPAPTVPVTDDRELTQRWTDLLPAGPPAGRTLWLAWLRLDGTMVPTVVPIEELPEFPTPSIVSGVLGLHDVIAEAEDEDPDDLHLTVALERPGPLDGQLTASDEEWVDLLTDQVSERLAHGCSVHVADGRGVRQVRSRPSWPQLG